MTVAITDSLGTITSRVVDCLRLRYSTVLSAWVTAAEAGAPIPTTLPTVAITAGDQGQIPVQQPNSVVVEVEQVGVSFGATAGMSVRRYQAKITAYTRRQIYRTPVATTTEEPTIQTSTTISAQALAEIAAQALALYAVTDVDGVYWCSGTKTSRTVRPRGNDLYAHQVLVDLTQRASTGVTT